MDIVWKVVEWLVVAGLTVAAVRAYDRWRSIRIASSNWQIEYYHSQDEHGQPCYSFDPAGAQWVRYGFRIRFFNTRRRAIGLHHISLEFWDGWKLLTLDESPFSGEGRFYAGQMHYDRWEEITLLPRQWVAEVINGAVHDAQAVAHAKTIWLSAQTAEGPRQRWLVHRMEDTPHHLATPTSASRQIAGHRR